MNRRYPEINSPQFGPQALSEIVDLMLTHLPLGVRGRDLDDHLIWEILCYASVKRISIESACFELYGAPSGNTTREQLNAALEPSRPGMLELEAQLNRALKAQLPNPVRRRMESGRMETAIDLVEIPYHGQALADSAEVRRGAASDGTTHFHMYGTLSVVDSGQRFTLALTFVWAGEKMEAVVARVLKLARALGLRFKRLYCDKGFCSIEVLRLLRQHRIAYIIPIPARGGAGGIKGLFGRRRSYHTSYTFRCGTRQAYRTEVVIVRRSTAGRYGRHGVKYFAYAVSGLGRVPAPQIFEMYRRRFGIESSYRQMHQVRARTSSRNPALRLLLAGLALLIVNLWMRLRQFWVAITSYGRRIRIIELTLERIAETLSEIIKRLLEVMPIFEIEAAIHGT